MKDTAGELDRVDRLMMVAYDSSSRRRELMLYLAVQPDGWFVVTDGDQIVAAAGAIAYGPFCWLGLVATEPERRGQGLATRLSTHLLRWARQRGCKTIALDASEAGRPVYERLGFQVLGVTVELSLPSVMPTSARSTTAVRAVEDVHEFIEADRRGSVLIAQHCYGPSGATITQSIWSHAGTAGAPVISLPAGTCLALDMQTTKISLASSCAPLIGMRVIST